ncbi:MAG TPA: hypothetical protein VF132_13755 [Rudaea sp.]
MKFLRLIAFSAAMMPLATFGNMDPFLHGAREVAVGDKHSCAVLADTTVACWGDNSWGQLGNGNTDVSGSSVPVPVRRLQAPNDVLTGVTAIAAGANFTCALQGATGTVFCWGRNDSGQLGAGVVDFVGHPYAIAVPMPSADGSETSTSSSWLRRPAAATPAHCWTTPTTPSAVGVTTWPASSATVRKSTAPVRSKLSHPSSAAAITGSSA